MDQVDPHSTRRRGLWTTLAIATVTSASAVSIALPRDLRPPTPRSRPRSPATTTAAARRAAAPRFAGTRSRPGRPGAGPHHRPHRRIRTPRHRRRSTPTPRRRRSPTRTPGRVGNAVGGFSFVVPPGWVESDASHLDYGSALLSKTTGQPPMPGQPPPVANDTRIVMGRLDQKLYASAEAEQRQGRGPAGLGHG